MRPWRGERTSIVHDARRADTHRESVFHALRVTASAPIRFIVGGRLVSDELMVDKPITEVGILVNALNEGLERCRDFQGAVVMGGGRVGLVLNVVEQPGIGEGVWN